MTEVNRMPNFWWCPTHHLYRGGDQRPCADAVRLVPASPTTEDERGRALAQIRDALAVRDADTAVPDAYVVDTVRAVLKEVVDRG